MQIFNINRFCYYFMSYKTRNNLDVKIEFIVFIYILFLLTAELFYVTSNLTKKNKKNKLKDNSAKQIYIIHIHLSKKSCIYFKDCDYYKYQNLF